MITTLPDNKRLGTVFNNDLNNIILGMGATGTIDTYRQALDAILAARPGVFAQDVGLPEALLYPTDVDNMFDKHLVEVTKQTWPEREQAAANAEGQVAFMGKVRAAGTDLLTVTIEACRQRSVPVVADYRMNAEDWYDHAYRLSDFGRAHPEWRIPLDPEAQPPTGDDARSAQSDENRWCASGTSGDAPPKRWAGCLDPAIPEVFAHRLAIFTEVADRYDIDGIEFDFRRWYRMISDPRHNYAILTRLVAQTRAMLDETARRKGRERMLLGVRVGAALETPPSAAAFPGVGSLHSNPSCRDLGLDVRTWIELGLVDYVCPTLFWPRWPGLPHTGEFAALAQDTGDVPGLHNHMKIGGADLASSNVGIYPTLFPLPAWLGEAGPFEGPISPEDEPKLRRYKRDICELALRLYDDGADGISTFNWYFHLYLARVPHQWQTYYGYGAGGARLQQYVLSILHDPAAIRAYLHSPALWSTEAG